MLLLPILYLKFLFLLISLLLISYLLAYLFAFNILRAMSVDRVSKVDSDNCLIMVNLLSLHIILTVLYMK